MATLQRDTWYIFIKYFKQEPVLKHEDNKVVRVIKAPIPLSSFCGGRGSVWIHKNLVEILKPAGFWVLLFCLSFLQGPVVTDNGNFIIDFQFNKVSYLMPFQLIQLGFVCLLESLNYLDWETAEKNAKIRWIVNSWTARAFTSFCFSTTTTNHL